MLSIFPALEIKKLVFVGKILWLFDIILHIMVNLFVFSLDNPVMINILYKVIKTLQEKMLNAIFLYWFHNGTSEKNNSLNGHSNEPFIPMNLWKQYYKWEKAPYYDYKEQLFLKIMT